MNPRRALPIGAAFIAAAILTLAAMQLLRPMEMALTRKHAIWLDRNFTFGWTETDKLYDMLADLRANGIGKVYAYASTLGLDGRWDSGIAGDSFMDTRARLTDLLAALRAYDEGLTIYAWLEIWTRDKSAADYRLDDEDLRQNIAEFSRMLVDEIGFDGLMLDIKPLFKDNDDVIGLIRRVRSAIGLDKPIGIAVTADLTPDKLRAQAIAVIAPGTMWSEDFKRRILVSADEVALTLFASYRQQRAAYIDWVAYHIEATINLLEIDTEVYATVPHYRAASPARNPTVETMAAALEGIQAGLQLLPENKRGLLTGAAIYPDRPLSAADWTVFRAGRETD